MYWPISTIKVDNVLVSTRGYEGKRLPHNRLITYPMILQLPLSEINILFECSMQDCCCMTIIYEERRHKWYVMGTQRRWEVGWDPVSHFACQRAKREREREREGGRYYGRVGDCIVPSWICMDGGCIFLDRTWIFFWINHAVFSWSTMDFFSESRMDFFSDRPCIFSGSNMKIFRIDYDFFLDRSWFFLDRPWNFFPDWPWIISGSTMNFFLDRPWHFFGSTMEFIRDGPLNFFWIYQLPWIFSGSIDIRFI